MARLEIFIGVLLAVCLSVSARSTASSTVMNLHLYSNATARSAVCNDGTPSGFYFRTGGTTQGANSSKFVIHLQGGAWCFDQASCQSRWQSSLNLMSSSPWPSTFDISSGIFAPDPHRNPFYDWNAAYVQYCSSDTWSGNSSATFAGKQWQFQGHNILIALIEDLWSIYGLSSATEIVFSGCSAGGQGVIVNLDFFASYLLKKGSTAKVKGLADAGWLQNLVPWSGDIYTTPIQDQMQKGIQLWGGIVHQGCAYSNNYGWQWLCYLSPFAYPHIRTPVFIQSEQYDTYQVTSNCCNPPFDSQESAYVATVRESFAASMYTVQPPNGVFSAACFHHCSSEDNTFYSITIDKVSMADAVGFWYQDSKNTPVKIIDSCRGFNCSSGCPSAPY